MVGLGEICGKLEEMCSELRCGEFDKSKKQWQWYQWMILFLPTPWLNINQLFSFLLEYGNASYKSEDKSQVVGLYN